MENRSRMRASFRFRLLTASALCVSLALIAAGWGLKRIFSSYAIEAAYRSLEADLDELVVRVAFEEDGTIFLSAPLSDPLFQRPLSGRYWAIFDADGDALLQSRSLWDETLQTSLPMDESGALVRGYGAGPGDVPLTLVGRRIVYPENKNGLQFIVTEDQRALIFMLQDVVKTLSWSLGVLGLAFLGAVWMQTAYGLRPLRRLRLALIAIRRGKQETLDENYPSEIVPLVKDLNTLLRHNATLIREARTQAGNLAHALKTPLAVVGAEADALETEGRMESAALLQRQVSSMQRHVDIHLARAHAQAAGDARGGKGTPIMPSLLRLAQAMQIIHGKPVSIDDQGAPPFRGDAQTLEEILGNLTDNAGKWAQSRIQTTALSSEDGKSIVLRIEDDGPGIPEERLSEVLQRGKRLDETKPGSGLGLSIVKELVQACGGAVAFDRSPECGGLRVTLRLPSLEDAESG